MVYFIRKHIHCFSRSFLSSFRFPIWGMSYMDDVIYGGRHIWVMLHACIRTRCMTRCMHACMHAHWMHACMRTRCRCMHACALDTSEWVIYQYGWYIKMVDISVRYIRMGVISVWYIRSFVSLRLLDVWYSQEVLSLLGCRFFCSWAVTLLMLVLGPMNHLPFSIFWFPVVGLLTWVILFRIYFSDVKLLVE